jgi:putative SOS response-associated peptidase YedK
MASRVYGNAGAIRLWVRTPLTFSVITTDASSVVEHLHDRMPVILPERDYGRWLGVDSPQLPMDLLRPDVADQMTA